MSNVLLELGIPISFAMLICWSNKIKTCFVLELICSNLLLNSPFTVVFTKRKLIWNKRCAEPKKIFVGTRGKVFQGLSPAQGAAGKTL